MTATVNIKDAYIIGQNNFDSWSQGFDTQGYLKVLPHPDETIPFKDPFQDWQSDLPEGSYYSSWGPNKELTVTLKLSELQQIEIDGFGILKEGDGIVPWLGQESPYENLRAYNGTIPGPMLITEPGDTLNITLENDLDEATNLHTHGLHVSPVGDGDNVLIALNPGESWDYSIEIPADHFIGLDWYHPHLHGSVNVQVSSGAAGQLLILPPHDLPDLDKYNPKDEPFYTFALNTFGLQQVNRPSSPDDPLNTSDPSVEIPAGTPIEELGTEDGKEVYQLSDAPFIGYNAKPASYAYDPAYPAGNPNNPALYPYGGGPLSEPVENVIHTVNGQYNPTLDLTTGEWNLFTFNNMNSNAFHVIQVVKDTGTELIPQEVTLVGLDGDAAGVVASNRAEVDELPLLNPGSRISFQELFAEPGTYYVLSNGTEEILGENTSSLIDVSPDVQEKGFNDGHLIWGSQVLATINVTGDVVDPDTVPFPETYDILEEQAQEIDDLISDVKTNGADRERTFVWSSDLGGAFALGNVGDDLDVSTFEGTWKINGHFFSADGPPLAMPMLGSKEIWNMKNTSGQLDPNLNPSIPFVEWHPFHIHQNDFTVLEVNGIPVEDLKDQYLGGVLQDTIALPPAHVPGSVTVDNPDGIPAVGYDPSVAPPGAPIAEASEVKILMDFADYPGTYVNHCHILFHEDAGMMQAVRVVLNTEDTWLGNDNNDDSGQIQLSRASNFKQRLTLTPYGEDFHQPIDVAIADVNYKLGKDETNSNVTDNVTDVVTVQKSLASAEDHFTIKVFDGESLIQKQEGTFSGSDEDILLTEIHPFQDMESTTEQVASVATGDVNGDGFADLVVGLGGGISPIIEVYSGKDYQLMAKVAPFHHEMDFQGAINLAVGDANGDNFDDIIVGQGDGGKGLVEAYSGIVISDMGADALDNAIDTAHTSMLLSEPFQPYGESYTGGVEVTSGYILQRPDTPNDEPVQTHVANITTLATSQVPEGTEQIMVHTYVGAGHGSHEGGEHDSEHPSELRMDAALTPETPVQSISGTFADLPKLERGEPILFGTDANGDSELIHLGEENVPDSIKFVVGTNGDDTFFGTAGNDVIQSKGGNDGISGLAGNDNLNGGNGHDGINGGEGNDALYGANGNDTLYGYAGNDNLVGGTGDDLLNGGAGNDRFRFKYPTDGLDTILDFTPGEDTLMVSASGFGGGLVSGSTLDSDQLVLGTTSVDANSRFLYDFSTGKLCFDSDGNGITEPVLFATLTSQPIINNTDIFVTA